MEVKTGKEVRVEDGRLEAGVDERMEMGDRGRMGGGAVTY